MSVESFNNSYLHMQSVEIDLKYSYYIKSNNMSTYGRDTFMLYYNSSTYEISYETMRAIEDFSLRWRSGNSHTSRVSFMLHDYNRPYYNMGIDEYQSICKDDGKLNKKLLLI